MTKEEKDAINGFIQRICKTGAMVQNVSLPKELHARTPDDKDKSPDEISFAYTKVLSLQQVLDEWSKVREQLEPKNETES